MKRITMQVALIASACGGAVVAFAHGAQIMGRLSTNHSEPVVSAR